MKPNPKWGIPDLIEDTKQEFFYQVEEFARIKADKQSKMIKYLNKVSPFFPKISNPYYFIVFDGILKKLEYRRSTWINDNQDKARLFAGNFFKKLCEVEMYLEKLSEHDFFILENRFETVLNVLNSLNIEEYT